MPNQYYIQISRRAFGPFSCEALQEMIAQGRIESTTLLSLDKQTWEQARAFPELFSDDANVKDANAVQQKFNERLAASIPQNNDVRKWFISVDGRESLGPFTIEELIDFFLKKKISRETLVWRQGDKNSYRLGEVKEICREFKSLLFPEEQVQVAHIPVDEEIRREIESLLSAQDTFVNESTPPKEKEIATSPKRNVERSATKIKTRFLATWSCIGVMTIAAIIALALQRNGIYTLNFVDFTIGALVYLFAGLALIGAVVFGAAFLHAFWSTIPKEIARANPNEAVAFIFIPGFGIYWIFQALYGGALDANEALKQCDESKETSEENSLFVSPGWALATSVFFDLGGPFNPISGFFFLLCLGVTTVQMKKIALKLDSLKTTRS